MTGDTNDIAFSDIIALSDLQAVVVHDQTLFIASIVALTVLAIRVHLGA